MADVVLREIEDGDLDGLFEQMRDAESVRMAAFVDGIRTTARRSMLTWRG